VQAILEKRRMHDLTLQGFVANPISSFSKKFNLRKNKATKMFVKAGGNIERLHANRDKMY
jgi:hypothetical protein